MRDETRETDELRACVYRTSNAHVRASFVFLVSAGIQRRLQVFTTRLSASRQRLIVDPFWFFFFLVGCCVFSLGQSSRVFVARVFLMCHKRRDAKDGMD